MPKVRLIAMGLVFLVSGGCGMFLSRMPQEIPTYVNHSAEGLFLAGAAKVEITPTESVWMGGYGILRGSQGVHDPLYARALVLERGNLRFALVSVDLVGIQRQDLLKFLETLDFPPGQIVVCSTHNHSGPDTIGFWGLPPVYSGQDSEYMQIVFCGIRKALKQAQENLRPAEIAATAVTVDPAGIMKNIRRPGVVDRELIAVHLREQVSKETIATLVELGCHSEVVGRTNQLISADFPGWTVARLEAEMGGVGVYVVGAVGGLVSPDNPDDPERSDDDWPEAEKLGLRVADLVIGGLKKSLLYNPAPNITVWHAPTYLHVENLLYKVARFVGLFDRDIYRGNYVLTEVNVWEIGGLRIATVPGEITPDLGLRIKKALSGDVSMLIGLANDELGYFLPEADYDLRIYSYERTLCPGRKAGDAILRRIEDLMLMHEQFRRIPSK